MSASSGEETARRRGLPGLERLQGMGDRLPTLLLAGAMAVSAVLLLILISKLTFLIDDWDFLLHRRGLSPHVFLDPHAEHISIAPVAIYKAIQAGIGMESLLPYGVVSTAIFLIATGLLFEYLRRRCGAWLALAGVLPILFLGSASEDLLTPFQVGYFGSMAAGLGMLLAMQAGGRPGDWLACALLVVSLSFSSLGLAFLAGAAVSVALDRDRYSRIWIVAIPALFYALWWLGWGHKAHNQLSFENVATTISYVFDGFASSVSSLLGLATPRNDTEVTSLDWGRPLLIGLLFLGALRLRSIRGVPRQLWVVGAIALSFWILASSNSSLGRAPSVSRYQYVGAVFVLLIVAELVPRRPGRTALCVVFAVVAAAVLSNVVFLRDQYHQFKSATEIVRGDLAGLELASDRVAPGFLLTGENSNFNYFTLLDAGSYLSAAEKFGSPAYDSSEILTAPEPARAGADKVAAAALGIGLSPARAAVAGADCMLEPTPTGQRRVQLAPGGITVTNLGRAPIDLSLARFAEEPSVSLGPVEGRSTSSVGIPADRSKVPWRLLIRGHGETRICKARAATSGSQR